MNLNCYYVACNIQLPRMYTVMVLANQIECHCWVPGTMHISLPTDIHIHTHSILSVFVQYALSRNLIDLSIFPSFSNFQFPPRPGRRHHIQSGLFSSYLFRQPSLGPSANLFVINRIFGNWLGYVPAQGYVCLDSFFCCN